MSKFAVLGSPIDHSKSPDIHLAAFRQQGLNHEYGRFELSSNLPDFLAEKRAEFSGFSVTMPLKEQAYAASTVRDQAASESGAVNTLRRIENGWAGFNTDIPGLQLATKPYLGGSVAILGSGATARSALLALNEHEPFIWARDGKKLEDLTGRYGISRSSLEQALRADLVISTLPAGALDKLVGNELFSGVLFDVTYDPWPNLASSRFSKALSGLELLVSQAIFQQRIFLTGTPEQSLPDEASVVQAMRAAIGLAE